MSTYDLSTLLLERKAERSFERLSKDCGGYPTANRLQQIATGQLNEFPNPDTIKGIARGTGLTVTEVVLASARSLGLPVRDADLSALVIAGAGDLPAGAKETIYSVARQMMRLAATAVAAAQEIETPDTDVT